MARHLREDRHKTRVPGATRAKSSTRTPEPASGDWVTLAIDAADLALWDYDVASGRVRLSAHWARMMGLPEGPVDTDIHALTRRVPEADREQVRATLVHSLKHPDAVYRMEHKVLREDGAAITIMSYGRVVSRDTGGRALRMVGTNRDISWYANAVEELRRSELLLRAALEGSAIGMALVAPDGRWLKVNKALCDIVGYSEEELLARTFQDITHPDDLDADLGLLRETLEGRRSAYQLEKRYLHRNGHQVWVQLNVALVRDVRGQPLEFVSQIQDISARKRAVEALRDSEARLKNALQNSPIGMALVGLDGRFQAVNLALCELVGYSEAELLGLGFPDITHPDDLNTDLAYVKEMLSGKRNAYEMEKRYVRKDGAIVWIQLNGSVVRDEAGRPLQFIAQIQDVSERHRTRKALIESEQRLEAVLAGADLGTWDWDVPSGRVVFNERWAQMLGYRLEEIEPHVRAWEKLVHPDDMPRVRQILDAHLRGETPLYETEHRMRSRHGEWIWILDRGRVLERSPDGLPLRASGTHMDITDRKTAQRRAEHLALHDPLTDLPNQRLLLDRMEVVLATARRRKSGAGVLFIDLDGFKAINDMHGHAAGDAVLKTIAGRLTAVLRASDTVARVGGDEFVVMLPEAAARPVLDQLSARIIERIGQPITLDNGAQARVSASIGIALYPQHGEDTQSLLQRADTAMYEAKRAGGARAAHFGR